MNTPLEDANLNVMFSNIMRKHQLKPEQVDRHGTQMHIFNTGSFQCLKCGWRWRSKFSWLTFNLKEMKVDKSWQMLCTYCDTACHPFFTMPQYNEMYERAVTLYMRPKSDAVVDIGHGAGRRVKQPHKPELCEKCGWGRAPCFRRFRQFY